MSRTVYSNSSVAPPCLTSWCMKIAIASLELIELSTRRRLDDLSIIFEPLPHIER